MFKVSMASETVIEVKDREVSRGGSRGHRAYRRSGACRASRSPSLGGHMLPGQDLALL